MSVIPICYKMMSTLFHVILVAVSQTALEVIGGGGGGAPKPFFAVAVERYRGKGINKPPT